MKKAIKRTFTILAAATTLLVSGASMTANAACQYHHGTYQNGYYIDNCYYGETYTYSWNGHKYRKTAKYCKCCRQFVGYTPGQYVWGT